MLVNFEYVGLDKPPDFEFVGLVNGKDWKALETLEQAVDRKNRFKSRYQKEEINHNPYWHTSSRLAQEKSDELFRILQN